MAGVLKAIAAIASVSTAILLLPIIPKAVTLRSPAQLEAANRDLQAEIAERQRLEKEHYGNLDDIKEKLCAFLEEFSKEEIVSIAGWDYILSALATVA